MSVMTCITLTGCSSFNSINDDELVRIATSYYNYYYSSKKVEISLRERGEYEKECSCYPVKFLIVRADETNIEKTLYFYKNDSGKFEVREFKNGIKFVN